MHRTNTRDDYEFLFAALAEKHNAVIRKIREVPPWEWGGKSKVKSKMEVENGMT